MNTLLYRLANMLLLFKCFDIKMAKLPGCSSLGASLCDWPTKNKKKKRKLNL